MTPKEYLQSKLSELAHAFPAVTIKYGFDMYADMHIVELTPESEYYHNPELDSAWIPISSEFQELYPNEDIVFVSTDSFLKVTEPIFEWNTEAEFLGFTYYNDILSSFGTEFKYHMELPNIPNIFGLGAQPMFEFGQQFIWTEATYRRATSVTNYSSHVFTFKDNILTPSLSGDDEITTDKDELPLAA